MSVDHYENFPVASLLLPRPLREPVAAIYAFARSADDFADEGSLPAEDRLRRLSEYRQEIEAIEAGQPSRHPVFLRLRPVIARFRLPLGLFLDLLDAFAQDVVKSRYESYDELADYCRRSANPVGRLLLYLFEATTAENLHQSDSICTALQLINHWQDVAVDWAKPRVYLPAEDMRRFGVGEEHLRTGNCDAAWKALLRYQVDRARRMMLAGAPLGRRLPGRIGLEIRSIVAGGLRILDKIEAVDYDIFRRRPVLTALDSPRILWRAL